jgi:hypothetical protein
MLDVGRAKAGSESRTTWATPIRAIIESEKKREGEDAVKDIEERRW